MSGMKPNPFPVLIPRVPYHSLTDTLSPTQALLTVEMLTVMADEAVDIARRLGDRVSVMGLSVGGKHKLNY